MGKNQRDEDCAFYTRQYEDAKERARTQGDLADIHTVLDAVDAKITAFRAVLGQMNEAATQPLPGISLRRTPQEKAMQELADLTALRQRIVEESDVDAKPLGN